MGAVAVIQERVAKRVGDMSNHVWTTAGLLFYRVPAKFVDQLPKLEQVFPNFIEIHHSH